MQQYGLRLRLGIGLKLGLGSGLKVGLRSGLGLGLGLVTLWEYGGGKNFPGATNFPRHRPCRLLHGGANFNAGLSTASRGLSPSSPQQTGRTERWTGQLRAICSRGRRGGWSWTKLMASNPPPSWSRKKYVRGSTLNSLWLHWPSVFHD